MPKSSLSLKALRARKFSHCLMKSVTSIVSLDSPNCGNSSLMGGVAAAA